MADVANPSEEMTMKALKLFKFIMVLNNTCTMMLHLFFQRQFIALCRLPPNQPALSVATPRESNMVRIGEERNNEAIEN
jgi:hypothetical protein